MQKVLFLRLAPWMGISHPHPQDIPYAYDLAQVSALLDPREFKVGFIDGMVQRLSLESLLARIRLFNPDILAITSTTSCEYFAFEIFRRAKAALPGLYTIAFGQHAHYSPQEFLNFSLQVDACVYGEPESTLVQLIKERPSRPGEKEKVKGIYFWDGSLRKSGERALLENLDDWPMPDYEIFKGGNYRIVSINFSRFRNVKAGWILASRGCPYDCTICSPAIRRSFGSTLRRLSPRRVAESFKVLSECLGVNTVYFADDVFTLDMEWAEKVSEELLKEKNRIQWGMCTRVDRLSAQLIRKMKDAGLSAVSLGVESASERILKEINKRISLEQIKWALSEFTKNRISVNVTAIVGHVDETTDELNQTLNFLKNSPAFFVQLHYLSPYPGTKIAEVFRKRLGNLGHISHFNALPLNVSRIPDKILAGSVQRFYLNYYLSRPFIKKYLKYRLPYLASNLWKELKLINSSLAYFLFSGRSKKVFVPRQSISVAWPDFLKSFYRLAFKSDYGRDTLRWEEKFAAFLGVPYAVSFISERAGTYFTLKALKEMNRWENPEIICPSYTFFSVPWAAKLAGWQVRFADIRPSDLNLDPESLLRQINSCTKAVAVTHLNGRPADIAKIAEICRQKNLRLLEDCAHTIGIESDGRPIGSWDIGCFSFGDGKNLGTFCGGMITTSDPELAQLLKSKLATFPRQSKLKIAKRIFDSLFLKTLTSGVGYFLFLYPLLRWSGFLSADNRRRDFLNFIKHTEEKDLAFKFSDLQALVGLSQLEGLEERNEKRRFNSRILRKNLSGKTINKLLPWDGYEPHTMLHDAIILEHGMEIVRESLKRGLDLRLDYCCNCRLLPGMENFPGEDTVAKEIDRKVFFIPNHLGMNPALSKKVAFVMEGLCQEKEPGG